MLPGKGGHNHNKNTVVWSLKQRLINKCSRPFRDWSMVFCSCKPTPSFRPASPPPPSRSFPKSAKFRSICNHGRRTNLVMRNACQSSKTNWWNWRKRFAHTHMRWRCFSFNFKPKFSQHVFLPHHPKHSFAHPTFFNICENVSPYFSLVNLSSPNFFFAFFPVQSQTVLVFIAATANALIPQSLLLVTWLAKPAAFGLKMRPTRSQFSPLFPSLSFSSHPFLARLLFVAEFSFNIQIRPLICVQTGESSFLCFHSPLSCSRSSSFNPKDHQTIVVVLAHWFVCPFLFICARSCLLGFEFLRKDLSVCACSVISR